MIVKGRTILFSVSESTVFSTEHSTKHDFENSTDKQFAKSTFLFCRNCKSQTVEFYRKPVEKKYRSDHWSLFSIKVGFDRSKSFRFFFGDRAFRGDSRQPQCHFKPPVEVKSKKKLAHRLNRMALSSRRIPNNHIRF